MRYSTSADVGTEKADEIRGLRKQACELLKRLRTRRTLSEQRAAENGHRDPMKSVTGRSALDCAIAATERMIERLDECVVDANGEFDAAHVEHVLAEVGSAG